MTARTLCFVTTGLFAAGSIIACQAEVEPARNTSSAGSAGSNAQGGSGGSNAGTSSSGGAVSSGGSTAGTTSSGGTAGSGGTSGGSGGVSGAAGSAGSAGAPTQSAGCGMPAGQELEEWVERGFNIDGVDRQAWVYLPANYDSARAYPVVFLFHGCTSTTNNVPMWNVTGENAILIRGAGISNNICWDSGPNSSDIDLFDAMVDSIEASHCVDTSRIFGVGYSSGAWLLNRLECVRGDVLRAVGTVAGGGSNQAASCVDTVARMFIHDVDDHENEDEGNYAERDRLIEVNGCDVNAAPVPEAPEPCARYVGCDPANPVIWCGTSGEGHGRQDQFASQAFWQLFSSL